MIVDDRIRLYLSEHFGIKHLQVSGYYLVEGLAHDSESGVPCVIYRKLYGDGGLWVRPLEMFLSRVDREKYPEVRQEYRFQLQEIASVAHHGE